MRYDFLETSAGILSGITSGLPLEILTRIPRGIAPGIPSDVCSGIPAGVFRAFLKG